MMQNIPARSINRRQLADILGISLNQNDFELCLQNLVIQHPDAGQQFWQSQEEDAGVYIILSGKVRLVDSDRQLLATLNPGDAFGEDTLFEPETFLPYWLRASTDVKIGYLPQRLLKQLAHYDELIENHLYHQAVTRNWLLLCPQLAPLHKQPDLRQVLSWLQRHNLPRGSLPSHIRMAWNFKVQL